MLMWNPFPGAMKPFLLRWHSLVVIYSSMRNWGYNVADSMSLSKVLAEMLSTMNLPTSLPCSPSHLVLYSVNRRYSSYRFLLHSVTQITDILIPVMVIRSITSPATVVRSTMNLSVTYNRSHRKKIANNIRIKNRVKSVKNSKSR